MRAGEEEGDRGWDGWQKWCNAHEFEQTLGDNEGQETLACYSLWGQLESDKTEWLNNNNNRSIEGLKKKKG